MMSFSWRPWSASKSDVLPSPAVLPLSAVSTTTLRTRSTRTLSKRTQFSSSNVEMELKMSAYPSMTVPDFHGVELV